MASDPEHRPEDSRAAPWSAATASPPARLADDTSFRISPPSISLPKGGGAIRGVGEKFAASPVTGSAGFSVSLPVSLGRGGFGPKLELSYDSGNGNGAFGFGWSLSLPSISRKTDKGLPLYADRTDTFLISGAEDLVPILDAKSAVEDDDTFAAGYVIRRYRPRIEGLFARIERWTRSDGDVHWRSISADNVLSTWPAGPSDQRRDQVIYYQYRHDRAGRTLRGIDQQIAKAERAVAGIAPVKRNRFIHLSGGTRRVNRSLEAKARSLAGLKGYINNFDGGTPEFVIGAYHRLFQIEKSFRRAKSDLAASDLPPHPRLDRGTPDHRVRRPRHHSLDRGHHRLVDQEVRQNRPPLPRDQDPGWRTRPHRSRPSTGRPPHRRRAIKQRARGH